MPIDLLKDSVPLVEETTIDELLDIKIDWYIAKARPQPLFITESVFKARVDWGCEEMLKANANGDSFLKSMHLKRNDR